MWSPWTLRLPIFITDNGAAYHDHPDPDGTISNEDRRHYFELHTVACADALALGHSLRGYLPWSLYGQLRVGFSASVVVLGGCM
jgi:beta-glucosidase/6-phospho-beta-glucosidase/beta-galactosidase